MAAGDRARVWFKNVEEQLILRWRGDMPAEELAALAEDLTEATTLYRDEQGISPPMYYCRRCKTRTRGESPVIHVGTMLFAAKRLGVIGDGDLSRLRLLARRYSERQRRTLDRDKDPVLSAQKQAASRCGCH